MNEKMVIEITDRKVIKLIRELEELQHIKVLEKNFEQTKWGLSNKYKGVFRKADSDNFVQHTKNQRKEWMNI